MLFLGKSYMDWKKQLQEAKDLFDGNLISEEEYNQMRKEALQYRQSSSVPPINNDVFNPLAGEHKTTIHTPKSLSLSKNPQNPLGNHGTMVVAPHSEINLGKQANPNPLGLANQTHIDPSLQFSTSNPLGGQQSTIVEMTSFFIKDR